MKSVEINIMNSATRNIIMPTLWGLHDAISFIMVADA